MAGTDKTKNQVLGPAPIAVLVNPQLGENIGTAARAMANFGLHELRLMQAPGELSEAGEVLVRLIGDGFVL